MAVGEVKFLPHAFRVVAEFNKNGTDPAAMGFANIETARAWLEGVGQLENNQDFAEAAGARDKAAPRRLV